MSDELIPVQNLIYEIRGQKVMLDFDLAKLYQVETKALNQSVRRNMKRFPADFMFRLTPDEFKNMRSQIVTFKQNLELYLFYCELILICYLCNI